MSFFNPTMGDMSLRDKILNTILSKILPYRDIAKFVTLPDGDKSMRKVIYLRRYFIKRTGKFKCFLHFFNRGDDDPDLHDHPWPFTTIPLTGGYLEETFFIARAAERKDYENNSLKKYGMPMVGEWSTKLDYVKPRRLHRRSADHAHRVHLIADKPVWTLVFPGAKERDWGFLPKTGGWIDWRTYLGLPADTKDQPEDL
mgnify:CR=1 FL=1